MDSLIYRLLISALALSAFYGIYHLLLSRLTSFSVNRAYLFSTMLLSMLMLFPWQRFLESSAEILFTVNLDVATVFPNVNEFQQNTVFNFWNLLLIIYLIPVAGLLGFFLFSNLRMLLVLRRVQIADRNNLKVVLLDHETLPFSWFRIIVMSKNDFQSPHAEKIIAHETTHIRQLHFMDLLLAELLVVIQWFNPAAWAFRKSVRDIHEYLADQGTLQSGYKIPEYQRLLASLAGPVTAGILSNNIKHSFLKNRFTMMTKTKNRKPATLRLATAIVAAMVIGFGMFITACQTDIKKAETMDNLTDLPTENEKTSEIQAFKESTGQAGLNEATTSDPGKEVFVVVEDPPAFPGGDDARKKYFLDNIKYPQLAREQGIQGTVFVTYVVEKDGTITNAKVLRGIGSGCDEEALRVIENMPRWVPGKQRGEAVRVQFNMPIKFALQ